MRVNYPTRKPRTKRLIIIGTAGLLVIIGGFLLYLSLTTRSSPKAIESTGTPFNTSPATDEQIKAGADVKQNSLDQDNKASDTSSLGVTISALNQDQDSDMLQVRTLINTVSNVGSCDLTLTKDHTTVKKSASIQALPTTSTCNGFDVPVSELSVGTWQVEINVTVGSQKGLAKDSIEIK